MRSGRWSDVIVCPRSGLLSRSSRRDGVKIMWSGREKPPRT